MSQGNSGIDEGPNLTCDLWVTLERWLAQYLQVGATPLRSAFKGQTIQRGRVRRADIDPPSFPASTNNDANDRLLRSGYVLLGRRQRALDR
jgi:hypothetical protein